MDKTPNKINNKEKQLRGGNWGHPRPDVKKNTNIKDPLYPEVPTKHRKKKKKSKGKKEFLWGDESCPFCEGRLKVLNKKLKWLFGRNEYENECHRCGAKEVDDCPCCHRNTWFKDGIFKHNNKFCKTGCGFIGKRLQ